MTREVGPSRGPSVTDQRQQLAAWLREWELDQWLQPDGMVAGDAPGPAGRVAPPPRRRAPPADPSPGTILLLAPRTPATDCRPVYVAVLAPQAPAAWLVAPFGRFSVPGLPGELGLPRRSALHLRVLCLWNRTVLTADVLRATWLAGRLTQPEWRAAWQVLACASDPDRRLSVAVARRVGPPLVHPADPRHLYQEQESALWEGLVPRGTASPGYPATGETSAWKRAAEEHPKYDE